MLSVKHHVLIVHGPVNHCVWQMCNVMENLGDLVECRVYAENGCGFNEMALGQGP
jgi:hypothetical protein